MAVSPSDPDDLIAEHLARGTYFLKVDEHRRRGHLHLDDDADAHHRPVSAVCRSGTARMPSWRATSTATAGLDLAVANDG